MQLDCAVANVQTGKAHAVSASYVIDRPPLKYQRKKLKEREK